MAALKRRLYDAIAKHHAEHGVSLTAGELGEKFDIGIQKASDLICAMVRQGCLEYGPKGTTRHLMPIVPPVDSQSK